MTGTYSASVDGLGTLTFEPHPDCKLDHKDAVNALLQAMMVKLPEQKGQPPSGTVMDP
jgi:hypothetical protein